MASLNLCQFIAMYKDEMMTLKEVSNICGIPMSTLRARLIEAGVMRSKKESQVLAGLKGRKGAHLIGKTHSVSEATKEKIRIKRLEWSKTNAKGVSKKPNGYFEVTIGLNKGKSEHRVIMEEYIGRKLAHDEIVHHKDNDRSNNLLDNLVIMSKSDHSRHHALETLPKRSRSSTGKFI